MAELAYVSKSNMQAIAALIKSNFALKTENTLTGVTVNGEEIAPAAGVAALTVPTKVSDLANDSGFQANVLEGVKVNGAALTPTNKVVDITVPTTVAALTDAADYAKKEDLGTAAAKDAETTLTNGANLPTGSAVQAYVTGLGYQTEAQVATKVEGYNYTTMTAVEAKGYQNADQVQALINTAVSSVYTVKGSKATYADLPASGNVTGDVWNVQAAYGNYPAGTNWVWDGSAWDALGGPIDLSGYVLASDMVAMTTAEINALFA